MRDALGASVAVVPSVDEDGRLVLIVVDAVGPLLITGVSMTPDEWDALVADAAEVLGEAQAGEDGA